MHQNLHRSQESNLSSAFEKLRVVYCGAATLYKSGTTDWFFKARFQDSQAIAILSRKEFLGMFRVGLHI